MFAAGRVKRERFRGHYYTVMRNKNGRFLSIIRYSKKVSKKQLYRRYKERGTFSLQKKRLSEKSKVYEYQKPISRRNLRREYGVIASLSIKGKGVLSARSRIMKWNSVEAAKAEADENLYYLISKSVYGNYDADDGEEFYNRQQNSIYYSFYYYD